MAKKQAGRGLGRMASRGLDIISRFTEVVVSNQETVISHISSSPVTPSAQSASAFSDHITAELRCHEELNSMMSAG